MNDTLAEKPRFKVSVHESDEADHALMFAFEPNGLQAERAPRITAKRVPRFVATVNATAAESTCDWSGSSENPEAAAREAMELEISARLKERASWIERVTALVDEVEPWAREMGWSTRRLEKRLDDDWIGRHPVPALLMQQETCRALLEPIGRSTIGTDGVVDLYLLPAYDDVASLYYYDQRWNLHHRALEGANGAPRAGAMPFSKETLARVLAEMQRNAA